VIAGGRSAGSQVACRTAADLGATAILILAYPLLGPGSPAELLSVRLPALVVQGGLDPFGRPAQFPALPDIMQLVEIPGTNHMFAPTQSASENSSRCSRTRWLPGSTASSNGDAPTVGANTCSRRGTSSELRLLTARGEMTRCRSGVGRIPRLARQGCDAGAKYRSSTPGFHRFHCARSWLVASVSRLTRTIQAARSCR
jgi:hypothetical protein